MFLLPLMWRVKQVWGNQFFDGFLMKCAGIILKYFFNLVKNSLMFIIGCTVYWNNKSEHQNCCLILAQPDTFCKKGQLVKYIKI